MASTEDDFGGGAGSAAPCLHLLIPGNPASVRNALGRARARLGELSLGAGLIGSVEIVLAEVLNNIVEHAFRGDRPGLIEIEAMCEPAAVAFRVRDNGLAMPGEAAPEGAAHDLDVADEDLPEGGFGWFLIRELTEELTYRRVGNRNELRFRVATNRPPATG